MTVVSNFIPGTGNEIKQIASWGSGSLYHIVSRFQRGYGAWYGERFVLSRVETWYEHATMLACGGGLTHIKRITAAQALELVSETDAEQLDMFKS